MAGHKQTNEIDMAWREQREDVALKVRQLSRRIYNQIMIEVDKEFTDALDRGLIPHMDYTRAEIRELARRIAPRVLEPGEVIDAGS